MLYTVECPKCGAKQKGLDLEETGGSFKRISKTR